MSSRSKKSNSGRARGDAAAAEEELSFGDLDMSAWVDPADAPEDLEKKRAVGGAAAILNGFRKTKTSDEEFVVDKQIQLDPFLTGLTPEGLHCGSRTVDHAAYPGAEHFMAATVFMAIDGHKPDDRTAAAAATLRSLMAASAGTAQAVAQLETATRAVASSLGALGQQYSAANGGANQAAKATLGAVPARTLDTLRSGLAAVQSDSDQAAQQIAFLRQAATERQTQFARFEQVRQDLLQVLIKPTRGVGAVAKMQTKEEALKKAHGAFAQADENLVKLIQQRQPALSKLFQKIVSDATFVLSRFCTHAADVVRGGGAAGGAAGGAQPAGAGGAAATYRVQIHRTQAGLGIILQTTHDGDPIVEVAQGAAAQAGVVAGSVVLSCCGRTVQGHGEGAVVAVIKGLPPQAPVELVLQRPAPNWNTTIRRR